MLAIILIFGFGRKIVLLQASCISSSQGEFTSKIAVIRRFSAVLNLVALVERSPKLLEKVMN